MLVFTEYNLHIMIRLFLLFEEIHVGVQYDQCKWDTEIEQEPDIYGFDVWGWRQTFTNL